MIKKQDDSPFPILLYFFLISQAKTCKNFKNWEMCINMKAGFMARITSGTLFLYSRNFVTNVLENYFTNPPAQMGVTLYFVLDKKGKNKNQITCHLESTATDENLFKFPRCLSVCPINIEILN